MALSEVLKVARLEPAALGRLEAHLASVMASKDAAIRDLKAELGRVVRWLAHRCGTVALHRSCHAHLVCPLSQATAHDRLIETYEKRLAEYGEACLQA